MNKRYCETIIKKLNDIKRSINIGNSILREKSDTPKYPDLNSLETTTKFSTIDCLNKKRPYYCGMCMTKRRNKCWAECMRIDRRKIVVAGIPYKREVLGEMNIGDLWILCAHLQINESRKTRSNLVRRIIEKQNKMDLTVKQIRKKISSEVNQSAIA
jgi:hypothetical protein